MERRAIVWISCALMAGIYFSEYARSMSSVAVIGALGGVCFVTLRAFEGPIRWKWFAVLIAFILGIALWHYENSRFLDLDAYVGKTVELSGTVYGLEELGDSLRMTHGILKADGKIVKLHRDIRLRLKNENKVQAGLNGSRIILRTVWQPAESAANPRGFDYGKFLERSGIQAELRISPWQIVSREPSKVNFRAILYGFRTWYGTALLKCLPIEVGSVAYGMAIGDTVLIPKELTNSYRVSGLGHLLSVSGLHFAILYEWLRRMLDKAKIRESRKTSLIIGVLTFMGFLNGWTAPALRAWGMILLLILARKSFRQYDGLTALSVIAALTALFQPLAVLQPGFQFSYTSVLGLLTLIRPIEAHIPIRNRHIREYMAASLAVQAAVIPLGIFWFGFWNPLTLLLNFPVMVLSEWLMPALVLFPFTTLLGNAGSAIAGIVIGPLVWGMNACSNFMVPQTENWLLPSPTVGRLISVLVLVLIAARLLIPVAGGYVERLRTNRLLLTAAVVFLGIHLCWSSHPRITFYAVGQGDAAMIEFHNRSILIDAGPAAAKLDRLLLRNGIQGLDALVITHGHEDHIGGAVPILKRLKVGSIIIGTDEPDNPLYLELVAVAREKGVPVRVVKQGDRLYGDGERSLTVLFPFENKAQEDPNAHSLVLQYEEGGFKTLFTGDLGKSGEEQLLERGLLSHVDLLKVPHHGSRTSNSGEWLEKIRPETAVISVGVNLYGLPNRDIMDAYRKSGVTLYRTDHNGAVRITFTGNRETLKTWR